MRINEDHRAVARIVAFYVIFSSLWIYFSGALLTMIFHDADELARVEIYKGLLFIFVTAILLYHLIARYVLRLSEANRRLRSSEECFQTIFDNMSEAVFIEDPATGKIIDVNRTMCVLYGYAKEEALRMAIQDLSTGEPPFSQKDGLEWLRRAELDGPQTFEWLSRKKDGKFFWTEVSLRGAVIGGDNRIIVQVHDISERKRIEEKLKLTDFSVDNIADAIQWITMDTRFWNFNPAACNMLGYTREELLSMSISDIDPYLTLDEWQTHLREIRQSGSIQHTRFHRAKDGRIFPVEITSNYFIYNGIEYYCAIVREITERIKAEKEASFFRALIEYTRDPVYVLDPADGCRMVYANHAACSHYGRSLEELQSMRIPDWDPAFDMGNMGELFEKLKWGSSLRFETLHRVASGALVPVEVTANYLPHDGREYVAGFFHDIGGRKQAEEKLRESEERYRGLVELFPDAIYIHTGGRLVFVNSQGAKLLGVQNPEDLYGREALDFVHPESLDFVRQRIEGSFRSGEPNSPAEMMFVRVDGSAVPVEVASVPFAYRGQKALQVIARDISGRKKVQEELLRAQKLESLGVLAGGIAHDFNNILTGIMGNLSLVRMRLPENHEALERIDKCEKAIKQATGLTCQLLTFSRGGEPVKKMIDLHGVIRDAVSFALRGSNVAGELSISGDLWPVEADEGQIGQVMNNLLINAYQAMPTGGIVRVEAVNCQIGENEVASLNPGSYVRISVVDNGCGISAKHLGRIFDPYFTTKKAGTGLGLTSLYSIVRKHGGEVVVISRSGEGTAFHVYLPASPDCCRDLCYSRSQSPSAGAGYVIVMDDEEIIRDVAGEMLTSLGYRVATCASGEEVVELYCNEMERGLRPDAVIMDLTVPGKMGGLEAASRILALDPLARLVVSSGYSNDPIMASHESYGFVEALVKPFRLEELSDSMKRTVAKT
ncbi:MAG TPA: PAS domain S-box protein [Geobacteraceae bacterium]|nr:PAS domain S-box protein [Geobacteraceae bacterium]